MKKAKLFYGDRVEIVEVPEAIVNISIELNKVAGEKLESFHAELDSRPSPFLIDNLDAFDVIEKTPDEEEADEIFDEYFYKIGEEIFNFEYEDTLIEELRTDDEPDDISLVINFVDLSD